MALKTDMNVGKSPSSSEDESDSDMQDEFGVDEVTEEQNSKDTNDEEENDGSSDGSDQDDNEDASSEENEGDEDENDGDESSNTDDEDVGIEKPDSSVLQKAVDAIESEESDDDDDSTNNIGGGDGEEEESDEDEEGNAGWADAMSKVLCMGKNTEKKVSILSKAKKDNVVKKVTSESGDVKEGDIVEDMKENKKPESWAVMKAKKKEIDSHGRRKPDILDRSNEKMLAKIATRGVVQLFNAVKEHQKSVKGQLNQAGKSFRKREKVYKNIDKNKFLEVLTGKPSNSDEPPLKKAKEEVVKKEEKMDDDQPGGWNILRDDFMLGAKMRDWDKQSDDEN